MTTQNPLFENKTYQKLNEEQKSYIHLLRKADLKPSDVETGLEELFVCSMSAQFIKTEQEICDALDELINSATQQANIVDTFDKMVKNKTGITNFLVDLERKPRLMEPSTWNILKGHSKPLKYAIGSY